MYNPYKHVFYMNQHYKIFIQNFILYSQSIKTLYLTVVAYYTKSQYLDDILLSVTVVVYVLIALIGVYG